MPVFAALAIAVRFSMARNVAIEKCCAAAGLRPYQASFVIITRKRAPLSTNFRTRFGKVDSKQITTLNNVSFACMTSGTVPACTSPMAVVIRSIKNNSFLNGTYSPNGTSCILLYCPNRPPFGESKKALLNELYSRVPLIGVTCRPPNSRNVLSLPTKSIICCCGSTSYKKRNGTAVSGQTITSGFSAAISVESRAYVSKICCLKALFHLIA